jgi:glycosyltransferase involved in cell wall biosynthesis
MTERIVVMFAYHFPPENAIGGARPYRFYKYLSEMGYRCHVITAADQGHLPTLDIEYVPDPFVTTHRRGIGWQVERAVRKLLFPGVAGFQWGRLACQAAGAFLLCKQNAEITIYSTFPPLGAHLAALLLARRNRLKWIADFRDPLSIDPAQAGFTKFQRRCHSWLEQFILSRADTVIVNSDALAGQWKSAYPDHRDRIHVIWNGFDPADRIEQTALPQRPYRLFSHLGALYGGRDISPLLESISRLIDTGRLVSGSLRIRLVGSISKDCIPGVEFLARAKHQGWLEIIDDHVPHHEARRMAQESDGLLLVQPHTAVLIPGKLFEYVRLRRPILAFILPDTPIERILKQSGATYRCVYAGDSFQEMDDAVQSFFNRKEEGSEANNWFEENFNAKKQTQALDALIRSMHERKGELS